MTLRDNAYILPSSLHVYRAPVGTAAPAPADINTGGTLAPAWVEIAHVADETGDGGIQLTRDGGDTTPKGSMAKKTIRLIQEAVTTGFELDFTQLSRETLSLYHGTTGGAVSGAFDVHDGEDGTTNTAFLAIWADGTAVNLALHSEKVAWSARDNIDTTSTEDAIRVPVQGTFLSPDTAGHAKYSWISTQVLPLS